MAKKSPMAFSIHNILGKIKNSIDYFIINILAENADIIDAETAAQLNKGLYPQKAELEKKGYLVNEDDEKILFINSYCEITEQAEKMGLIVHFVPWLTGTVFPSHSPSPSRTQMEQIVSDMVMQDFFTYLDTYLADRTKKILISGGEPLLPGKKFAIKRNRIIEQAGLRNIPLGIRTNGYYLHPFMLNSLKTPIDSIHISIDMHQTPFVYKNPPEEMTDYLNNVAKGITLSLEMGIITKVKCMVDEKTIEKIHLFASFAEKSGLTEHPCFSAEIISIENYSLCDSMHSVSPIPVHMIELLYNQLLQFPEILELSCPRLSTTKHLFTHNQVPPPLFQTCPGGRNELLCLYDGTMYPCIAAMFHPEESFGRFHPEVTIRRDTITIWDERDITTIEECKTCPVQLGCGSGCTVRAKENRGTYVSPDCIPVKKYTEAGLSLYFEKRLINK